MHLIDHDLYTYSPDRQWCPKSIHTILIKSIHTLLIESGVDRLN